MVDNHSQTSPQPFAHLNKFLKAKNDYREAKAQVDTAENQWLSNEQEKNIFKKCKGTIKEKGYI